MIEIPIKVQSSNMELKSLLFEKGDEIEFSEEASLIYRDTDAELGGFESEVVVEMTAAISSTEAVQPVAKYLYKKLEELDSVTAYVGGEEVEVDEEILRRRLMEAYYKN